MKQHSLQTVWRTLFMGTCLWLSAPSSRAIDPDLPFSSGSTGVDGPLTFREIPNGRSTSASAYDEVRQEVLLFGGWNGGAMGDTWVWRGSDWIRLQPVTSPLDRSGHRMVWDGARNEIVLFGGTRSSGRLNDTWTWNGTAWTQKSPTLSPKARDGFAMAYDAVRQKVVLFGGNNGGDETWLWDGTNWTQADPAHRPPASGQSNMAYDPVRQECVLFGNYGQTWVWNGADWTERSPLHSPPPRNTPTLIADGTSNTVLLFGGSNGDGTWAWNGTDWKELTPSTVPQGRQYSTMVWDAFRKRGVLFGGDVGNIDNYGGDTWLWDGANWSLLSGKTQTFDMTSRADGIWNFTTIHVPALVTVVFKKNAANTPVRWRATGDVVINGAIDLNGAPGLASLPTGVAATGGPGGFDGGLGAVRVDASGNAAGSPGQGPGGGLPGTAQQTSPTNLRDGKDAAHTGMYGNAFLQPLVGGSGGGGGSSSDVWGGGAGGGGGGALLISSSRDIVCNGTIRANGGTVEWSNASNGGRGSGGAILLRADRIGGTGTLQAFGGQNNNPNGRIRLESYIRTWSGPSSPTAVVGLPAANGELNQVGTLAITKVAGSNVVQPPSGNLQTPDVVFSEAGPIAVTVTGTAIPDNTPVSLRIVAGNSLIVAGPVNMVGGTAVVNATVPKGLGTIQATAQFTK